jgi:hypothetical protein
MIFGKEATKSPSEQHGSEQACEHNEGSESGIHSPFLPAAVADMLREGDKVVVGLLA